MILIIVAELRASNNTIRMDDAITRQSYIEVGADGMIHQDKSLQMKYWEFVRF